MSAFQVTESHIGAILRWYLTDCPPHLRSSWRGFMSPNPNDADDMMNALAAENAQSVAYRYPGISTEPVLAADNVRLSRYAKLAPVAVIKACQCLEYQSCEHPTWDKSDAKYLLEQIQSAAIASLPGYSQAAWAIEDEVYQ